MLYSALTLIKIVKWQCVLKHVHLCKYILQGYNNLFNSVLLFLYFVNKKEHGMLGMVNLGKSGINVLWVIDS